MQQIQLGSNEAVLAQQKIQASFAKKGSGVGIFSGLTFGLQSAVIGIALAMAPFTDGVSIVLAPLVGAAVNDSLAAIWLFIYNTMHGKQKEIWRSLRTKPGMMICIAALLGGPIANGAYLLAIQFAGAAYAIPISALFPMVGAILARIFLKQEVTKRVMLGMIICIIGAIVIGYTPPEGDMSNFYLGIVCALVAAFGWGAEGTISAFGTSVIDPNIAINIRQAFSGLFFVCIVLPIMGGLGVLSKVIATPMTMLVIAIAAIAAAASFLTWYKCNSMSGVAVGMALNSTYVMWGIMFSILLGQTKITTTLVVGALLVTVGAILVAIDPRDMFKKKEA